MDTFFTDVTALGLVALVIVLGYWMMVKQQSLLTKYLERQELLLQKILIAQMSCVEELKEIRDSLLINSG